MSKQSFADLGVSKPVCAALDARGINEPFTIQRLVIEDVMAGHDVLAKSPTGSGKTLAFAIPIVDRLTAKGPRPAALVLAPTRELAAQIVDDTKSLARARKLEIAAVYGGVGFEKQIRDARRANIIVATPGRLEDLLQRRAISIEHVHMLVLDEGDRMIDMGFRPAVDRIVAGCSRKRQTMFFSATLEGNAGRIAKTYTRNPRQHEHAPAQHDDAKVEHRFIAVKHHDRVDALVDELRNERELALVFVRTKRGVDRLVKGLVRQGVTAVGMHGDKSQSQRERALASFESSRVDTLVATDVAARGIDVEGISHVINYDPPEDREKYVHRVGRTGRAGRGGIGITFVGADRARDVQRIAGELRLHREFKESGLHTGTTRTPTRPGKRRRSYMARSLRR